MFKLFRKPPQPIGAVKIRNAVVLLYGDGPFLEFNGCDAHVEGLYLMGHAPSLAWMIRMWWKLRRYHAAKAVIARGID